MVLEGQMVPFLPNAANWVALSLVLSPFPVHAISNLAFTQERFEAAGGYLRTARGGEEERLSIFSCTSLHSAFLLLLTQL